MDFGQLKWRATKLAGRTPVDEVTSSPADVAEAVNDAYLELCDLEPWAFLREQATLAVVAGQQVYTLPAPLRTIESVTLIDGSSLRPRTGISRDALDPKPESGALREYVLRDPDTLEVWPEPGANTTLTVHGWRNVSALSVDADVPLIPNEYATAIAHLAAIGLLEQSPVTEGDVRIERYSAKVASVVDRMRDRYQRQHDRTLSVIGGRATRRRPLPTMGR